MNKKIYIEILWSTILGILSTQIPYYQWRNLVSQVSPDSLPRITFEIYYGNFPTEVYLWFFITFCVSMILIETVKIYFKKKDDNKE